MAGRRTSTRERFRRCLQIFLTRLFSHVGLCALVVAYSIGGAFLFELLEAERELDQRREIQRFRENCLADLWYLSGNLTSREWTNWTSVAGTLLKEFEIQVVTATKLDGYDGKGTSDAERQWSFSGSLLYSITVITTIGYGNLAPKTPVGKLVTMLYALIGIPVMLLFLSNIGTSMANAFQFAFAELCCSLNCCQNETRYRRSPPTAKIESLSRNQAEVIHVESNVSSRTVVAPKVVHPSVVTCQNRPRALAACRQESRIDVRDLAMFDYDIVDFPSSAALTDGQDSHQYLPEWSPEDQKWRRAAAKLYSLDRLNAPAKSLLDECARYSSKQQEPNEAESMSVAECDGKSDLSITRHQRATAKKKGASILSREMDEMLSQVVAADAERAKKKYFRQNSREQTTDACAGGQHQPVKVSPSGSSALDESASPSHGIDTDSILRVSSCLSADRLPLARQPRDVSRALRSALPAHMLLSPLTSGPLADQDQQLTERSLIRTRQVPRYEHSRRSSRQQPHPWAEKRRVPVLIVLAFLVGYICIGAAVFSMWEDWSFLDGAYFSFITLSTIGFGDLVPGSNVLSTETHEGQSKLVICCLYLVIGLAIIAMSFNLVQEEVVARFQKLGQELGILDEK